MRWQNWSYLFLLAVPAAFALRFLHAGPLAVFAAAGLGIVPLAALMGRATEALADRLGPHLGGLLNATFGNAAEFIISLAALQRGMIAVVKASVIGSIIGNALLTLGVSLLVGGLRYRRQTFDRVLAGLQANLLVLATIGLLVPSALASMVSTASEVHLSTEVSVVLLATYLLSVLFSLIHPDRQSEVIAGGAGRLGQETHAERGNPAGRGAPSRWGIWLEVGVLAGSTALVAVLSEYLVGAIEEARDLGVWQRWGVGEVFIGVIVVAIIGNAAEHSTAIVMAYRNKVDVTLNIAVGSSLQIALLVTPLLVFCSLWLAPRPLDLSFSVLELLAVAGSVLVVAFVAADGESHWMEGVLLLAVYVILALAFYHVPDVLHVE